MSTTSSSPIRQAVVDEYWKYFRLAGKFASQIEDRIDYIIKRIHQEAGISLNYWYFDDAPEGDQGSLHRALNKISISNYTTDTRGNGPMAELIILLNDGRIWCLWDGFPTRWLHEDFEKELVEGKAAYLKKEADKKAAAKAKRVAKKAEKEKLKASAAAKLTAKEKKALGL